MPSSKEDHLFFRLRIPKPLGDLIVDQAWQARRSTNSQILLLLEKAVGWEGESLVVETPAGRGAKAAGSDAEMRRKYDEAELEHRREMEEERTPPGHEPPRDADPTALFKPMSKEELAELRQTAAQMKAVVAAFKDMTAFVKEAAPAVKKTANKTPAKKRSR